MGYDCYMRIIGTLPLRDLLINNKNLELQRHDCLWQEGVAKAEKWITDNIQEKSLFFENIEEMKFDDFKLSITEFHVFSDYNNNDEFDITDYLDLMMYNLLLKAIDEDDPKIRHYLAIDVEDIEIDNNGNIKIDIYRTTSGRGSKPIDIDYIEIVNKISQLRGQFPMIEINTYLGLD